MCPVHLAGLLPDTEPSAKLSVNDRRLSYAMPQRLVAPSQVEGMANVQLRVNQSVKGELIAECNGHRIWSRKLCARPERRLLVPMHKISAACTSGDVEFKIIEPSD